MATSKMSTGQFRELAGAVLRSLRKVLREALVPDGKTAGNTYPSYPYPLTVDYGRSVENAVKLGRYDGVDSDINSRNFPTRRKGTADVAMELVHWGKDISTNKALSKLGQMGMRPAELRELLAFGEKYPDVQRKFRVVALGSFWRDRNGDRNFPSLGRFRSSRYLHLNWLGSWDEVCRFAAVRK